MVSTENNVKAALHTPVDLLSPNSNNVKHQGHVSPHILGMSSDCVDPWEAVSGSTLQYFV